MTTEVVSAPILSIVNEAIPLTEVVAANPAGGVNEVTTGVQPVEVTGNTAGPSGPRGLQGIQGVQGIQGNIGPRGINPRGDWAVGNDYLIGDTVTYLGSSYFCTVDHTAGDPISVSTHWLRLVSKGDAGPQGVAAVQDIGWGPLTGGFADGEVIDAPPLPHAATYTKLFFYTRSFVSVDQMIVVLLNDGPVASVTIHPGDHLILSNISPIVCAEADILSLQMPSPVDVQLTDFTASLRSA